jgi:hypothetical protein
LGLDEDGFGVLEESVETAEVMVASPLIKRRATV